MFISPYFGGCKYTNNFLFINKKPEFQHFDLLITSLYKKKEGDFAATFQIPAGAGSMSESINNDLCTDSHLSNLRSE